MKVVLTKMLLTALLVSAPGDHGRVEWFEGTFDQALAEAAKSKRIVLLDFWTKTCPYCKQLDRQTLNDNAVVEEARGFVCLPVDAESAEGRPIAERYGIAAWPALVYVESDGSLRDRFAGFRGAQQLVREFHRVHAGLGTFGEVERRAAANPKDAVARLDLVERLRQLHDERWSREMTAAREAIERGEGFDEKSPDDLYAVALRLRRCGDAEGYEQKIAAIRALDPDGKSAPLRQLALARRLQGLNTRLKKDNVFDSAPVRAFLAEERHASVLFEGWSSLYAAAARIAKTEDLRKQALECAREAWKRCPSDRTADFGREIAESFLACASQLSEDERAFAIDVAAKASEAAPRSVDHLETLATWLELAGRKADARTVLERATAIEPYRASVRLRLEALRR